MAIKRIFLTNLIIICCTALVFCQETSVFTDAQLSYKRGNDFFEKGLLAQAQSEYQDALNVMRPVQDQGFADLMMKAELGYAKSAVRMNQIDGEKLLADFVRRYQPDPLANEAVIEAGNFYYDAKEYEKAYTFFDMIDPFSLSKDQRSAVVFKKGYALFVRKKFGRAKVQFQQIKDIENKYYYPTNYYIGMCQFFEGKYDQALQSFDRVEPSKKYRNHIPYYKTQIYFAEGQYDQVLSYGLPQLANNSVRNQKEIHHLIGQTYFEQGEYAKALPYLEYYAERASKMRAEDFYQLGFVQHQAKNYRSAANNLLELSKSDSPLGQNALYILADSYINLNQKPSARSAFATAQKMNYDSNIQAESEWNYGKLSYELKYDREAITTLQKIQPNSPHYLEAQTIMSNIFLNTRDYVQALKTIESIPNKTPQLRAAYQKVAFYRGLQLHKDNNSEGAKVMFLKSLEVPTDNRTKALAYYWLGEIAHNKEDFGESTIKMNQFLTNARGINNLPDESSLHTANYTLGYNYLKQEDYAAALQYFRKSVDGIKANQAYISNDYVKNQLLGDAILRTGDCYFKTNDYNSAVRYYDEAISRKYNGYIYAIYQKAIIEGLRGNTTDKIIALERITTDYPSSEYADEALYALGDTYQILGKNNEAVKPLTTLVNQYKNSNLYNEALVKLGLITYNQGDYNLAIQYYKDVFNNNPDDRESTAALTALEEIYVDVLAQPQEYLKFLDTIPGYSVDDEGKEDLTFRSAENQFENGSYEKAIESYRGYLSSYPNGRYSLQAYYNTAESYAVLKDYSKALFNYENVMSRGQSRYYGKALNKAALIAYNHEKDFQKSYAYFVQLENIADTEELQFDAQIGALRAAYQINDNDAMIVMADKVRNNPKASNEQKAAANFYIGKIAFDKKDYATAETALTKTIQNSDNELTAEARYLIAYIHYQRRELEKAKELCINANKTSSNYQFWVAKSVILLGDILTEQNDLFNARAAFEAVIEGFTEDQSLVDEAKNKLNIVNKRLEEASRLEQNNPEEDLKMQEGN